ncbi:Uncharacterised protein [Actinobacillus pleuropneumoniae]|nr:Uncharacterised protein [Actinobacillus pleuropneumoniae]
MMTENAGETSINNEDMVKCSQLVLEAVTLVGVLAWDGKPV